MATSRRFHIRTYGCQMNVHDSEKLANLLHHDGWLPRAAAEDADLLVVNTCSIRDKAEHRSTATSACCASGRRRRPGGCSASAAASPSRRATRCCGASRSVDFVFGTHNLRWCRRWSPRPSAGERALARSQESSGLERFDLPERHPDLSRARRPAAPTSR